mmetsp:Transcript_5023/g.18748  ORF Transcript_5023/g.18748 Transcript_5023/m.18748 type:complete len:230 (+) Transcript_5023:2698-3387(+)
MFKSGEANLASLSLSTELMSSPSSSGMSPTLYPSFFKPCSTRKMLPNTLRYAAVPTLPLSGGKEKTVIASFLSTFFFLRRFAHFSARLAICDARPSRVCDLPVLESRPEKMTGSRAPSSSGSATCSATCTGCSPREESVHSSVVWKERGTVHMYGTLSFFRESIALGWSWRAGPPTRAKPVKDSTVSTYGPLVMGSKKKRSTGMEKSKPPAKIGTTLAPLASSSMTMPE